MQKKWRTNRDEMERRIKTLSREEDWQGAKETKQGKNEKMRQGKRYGTAQYSQGGRMNVRD